MNKKEESKQRAALALSFSFVVFIIIMLAALLAIAVVYILLRAGVIDSIDGRHIRFRNMALLMLFISMVLGFLLAFLTNRITLRPVNTVIVALNRLAKGDFSARVHYPRAISWHPTFKVVQDSFNTAAEELEHTELLRSDFINNFSHEFKTPIVSISGFAGLLLYGDLTEEERTEYLKVIQEESLRLSYMATNVLNLTKVENQTILTNVSTFNLSEQIRNAVLILAEQWTARNLEMDLDFEEYMISASEELLMQVWLNLIGNAVKFSDEYSTVSIRIREEGPVYRVSVSDHGQDIPAESMSRIFNRFYQADESHFSEGNGIGLAIVKKVASLHRGSVSAESGNGTTTFTVTLPVS